MISWLTKAASTTNFDEKIGRMKLSSIYDFIREFPMLYVEVHTKRELEKYKAMEKEIQREQMRLQWQQLQLSSKLEDIQQSKARAMRRL